MEEERKVRHKRQQRQQEDGDGDGDEEDEEESDEESHAKDENLRRFLKGWARRLRCFFSPGGIICKCTAADCVWR